MNLIRGTEGDLGNLINNNEGGGAGSEIKLTLQEKDLAAWLENNEPEWLEQVTGEERHHQVDTILTKLRNTKRYPGLRRIKKRARRQPPGMFRLNTDHVPDNNMGEDREMMAFLTNGQEDRVEEEEGEEGVVLERNIMEEEEDRLRRPDSIDTDLWTEILRLNSYLELKLSKLCEREQRERERLLENQALLLRPRKRRRRFRCSGCSFKCRTLRDLNIHRAEMEPRLKVSGRCEHCPHVAATRCSYNRHALLHNHLPTFREWTETGLFCKRCQRRVRVSKLALHKYFVHGIFNVVVFQDKFLNEWREWFHGK